MRAGGGRAGRSAILFVAAICGNNCLVAALAALARAASGTYGIGGNASYGRTGSVGAQAGFIDACAELEAGACLAGSRMGNHAVFRQCRAKSEEETAGPPALMRIS